MWYLPALVEVLCGDAELKLNTVDSVNTVEEQNQDEDKGDLEPVLEGGNEGGFGDEAANSG